MTNKIKKQTKEEKEIIYTILSNRVCKFFNFGDDLEPTISVCGCSDLGQYHKMDTHVWKYNDYVNIPNHIIVRPSEGIDTLAHELAHYVQTIQDGQSVCHEMRQANCRGAKKLSIAVADRHAELTNQIFKIISR